jgi:protein-tyrosine phosphatase
LAAPLQDFGGVPDNWKEFLTEKVIPLLKEEKTILAFCIGSHGRTGCFLASLIALIENETETPDPIEAVRKRHCQRAVETLAQAKAVFALRDQPLPKKYQQKFSKTKHVIDGGKLKKSFKKSPKKFFVESHPQRQPRKGEKS